MSAAGDPIVVAVDGPAGSGKSSVSRRAAVLLGFEFLDTGAAYRALTWFALEQGVDIKDPRKVISLIDDLDYTTTASPSGTKVSVNGVDVSESIREPRVTRAVSDVSGIPEVRIRLNDMFRESVRRTRAEGVVVEGRDITTVVTPDADVRILLTADEAVRIERRARQLAPGEQGTAAQLRERDRRDVKVIDFMTAAPGVTTIDSTHLDFDETVNAVLAEVELKTGHPMSN